MKKMLFNSEPSARYRSLPLFVLIFFSSLTSNLHSQIIYNSSDYAGVNDSFMLSNVNAINLVGTDFSATDTNMTWDYSGLNPNNQEVFQYANPDNSGYQATYIATCTFECISNGGSIFSCPFQCITKWDTLSNLALANFDSLDLGIVTVTNVIDFYKNTGTALEHRLFGGTINVGFIPQSIFIPLDPPDKIYQFPIAYNNSHTSNSSFDIDLSQFGLDLQFVQARNRVTTVEGWGTLITPFDTYPNTLKVKSKVDDNSTLTLNGTTLPGITLSSTTYSWFAPGHGIPVMKAEVTNVFGAEVNNSVAYIDTPRCLPPPFALFLNVPLVPFVAPASDSVLVSFNNFSQNSDSFTWDFGDPSSGANNTSNEFSPSHIYIEPGTYSVNLTACNTVCNPTECDDISITILILNSGELIANFDYSPDTIFVGDIVSFTNLSANHNASAWNFGDGNVSALENPTNQYTIPGTYDVTLIVNNATDADTITKQLMVNDPTGIGEPDKSDIEVKIYPNPFSEYSTVTVKSSINTGSLKLNMYDLAGKPIYAFELRLDQNGTGGLTIHKNQLPSGILFYTITNSKNVLNRGKMVVQD